MGLVYLWIVWFNDFNTQTRSVAFPMKPFNTDDAGGTVTFNNIGAADFTDGSVDAKFIYPLEAGRTLLSFKFRADGDGAADMNVAFSVWQGDTAAALPVTPSAFADLADGYNDYEAVLDDPYLVVEGDILQFNPAPSAAGIFIQSLIITYQADVDA